MYVFFFLDFLRISRFLIWRISFFGRQIFVYIFRTTCFGGTNDICNLPFPATEHVPDDDNAAQFFPIHGVSSSVFARYSSSWLRGGGWPIVARDRSGSHDKTKKLPQATGDANPFLHTRHCFLRHSDVLLARHFARCWQGEWHKKRRIIYLLLSTTNQFSEDFS